MDTHHLVMEFDVAGRILSKRPCSGEFTKNFRKINLNTTDTNPNKQCSMGKRILLLLDFWNLYVQNRLKHQCGFLSQRPVFFEYIIDNGIPQSHPSKYS